MKKLTTILFALPLFYVLHNAIAQTKVSSNEAASVVPIRVVPIRMEIKPLASTTPGIIRFSVDFRNLQPEKSLRVQVINPDRPFTFSIINKDTGLLANGDGRPVPHNENEDAKLGVLALAPAQTISFEVSYPKEGERMKEGSYEVQARMVVWEFQIGDQSTKLTDTVMLRSNEVDFLVKKDAPPVGIIPTQDDADKLPLAVENPARLPQNIHVGDTVPNFDIPDMNGRMRRLSDYKGKSNLLLTFFPKCFTGGCANHLSSLRDVHQQLEAANVKVLAVSVDPADGEYGQKAFADLWKFQFPLIPDTERKLSLLFGAVDQPTDLDRRMTFLIDKQGIVRWIDTNVQVKSHGADMLAKIEELGLSASK